MMISNLEDSIPHKFWKTRNYLGLPVTWSGFREDEELRKLEGYAYYPPLKDGEETLINASSPSPLSWLVVNRYGAVVLCTKTLLIADIDTTDVNLDYLESVLQPWFTKVYKTHSGYRVLSTRPTDYYGGLEELLITLRRIQCDPKYMDFMDSQRYGRARLTPKPWRCDPDIKVSVTNLISVFGDERTISPEQRDAFHIHDHLSKTEQDLPLA